MRVGERDRTEERYQLADRLIVKGAREHNLRGVDLDLPRDALIVFTGLSGSGKSSLAFDTIFAEGQRRYVESLSAYARQFLGQMDKPDVDFIEGLSPAVSIDQKSTNRNPRSTVGTITEVYDYLRLLYARAGTAHCPVCGERIARQTPQQIVDQVLAMEEGIRFQVLAPVVRTRKGEFVDLFEKLNSQGYSRVRVDGVVHTAHRSAEAQEAGEARHRGGRRPPHASRPAPSSASPTRSRPRSASPTASWCSSSSTEDEDAAAPRAAVLREAGLPQRARARGRRSRAAVVLVQLAVRRLPRVHRSRHPQGGRPRTGGARPGPDAGRGRHRAVVDGAHRRLLHPHARRASARRWASTSTPRGASCPPRRARRSSRAATSRCTSGTRTATAAPAPTTPTSKA